MTEYNWQWEKGDGPHDWLRDKSGTFSKERGDSSDSIGFIEPGDGGWHIGSWLPRRHVATLPASLSRNEAKAVAKTILLSLKPTLLEKKP